MKKLLLCLSISALVAAPLSNADELMDNIRAGNQAAALAAISSGEDVNALQANGTSALHWAVHKGDILLVQQLLAAGANVNTKNNYGASPMSEAAELGDAAIVKALLDAGADPESANGDGQTALMIVARSSNTETARILLEHGADVNATEQWQGQNALIWAAGQSQPAMVKLLLDAGADPDSRSRINERERQISAERRFQWRPAGGLTALVYAAREGCLDCVKLLVDAGAAIDQGDAENVSPLLAATINMHFDTALYLVQAGANVNKWSFRGENPVYSAVDVNTVPHGGYPDRPSTDSITALELLQALLEAGANPNLQLKLQPTYRHIKDDRGADGILNIGATPLLRAAKAADVPAMRLLFQYGALPNLANRNGITPVMAAAGLGSSTIDTRGDTTTPLASQNARQALEVLVANGGDIQATDSNGRTALHGAAGWGWGEAVSYLIELGARLDVADRNGLTPLDVAMGKSPANGRASGNGFQKVTADLLSNALLKTQN